DPPYQGVCSNRDSRYHQGIDFYEFVSELEKLNKKEIKYLVSYDGKTGDKIHGKLLPKHLNLTRVSINAGLSSQATLLGRTEITMESLYISEGLMRNLKNIPSRQSELLVFA
ncbi:MAG TPA: DNA adenine methylase, partial [Candidatus Nanoarchaeia archaeon]|nr:DNA adenine methylase [Candidatus Nanoarchaeia archaeon]